MFDNVKVLSDSQFVFVVDIYCKGRYRNRRDSRGSDRRSNDRPRDRDRDRRDRR